MPVNSISTILYIFLFFSTILFSRFIIRKYTKLSSEPGLRFFSIGFLSTLLLTGIDTLWPGGSSFDLQWQDTYFVIGIVHLYMAVALVLGLWTLIYYFVPAIISTNLHPRLSAIHGLISSLSLLLVILLITGTGHHQEKVGKHNFILMNESHLTATFVFICLFLFLISQLFFVINLVYTLWRSHRG